MNALRLLWDRLALFLPLLLMGALAMGTYWMVRSTPVFAPDQPAALARHEPDYFMREFAVRTYDTAGQLKSEVSGLEARHFPDTDTLEIDQVHIRSFNPQGRVTTATARKAITSGDGSEVQLMGGAKVVRATPANAKGEAQPSLVFTGEFLHAFMDTEHVKSHEPVELVRGQDRFTALRMDYDNQDRVMFLSGRVRGVLVPTKAP